MDKESQRERSQEVRLGLVMYGGVSLAIYINGVAQEFFRAVRGRGIYRLIKAMTDSDIVVDIISGSSAGGINGVLLAYALANELEFPNCAGLWRQEGDFLKLLRSPSQGVAKATSVLDGEHFEECLVKALAEMPAIVHDQPEYVSQCRELDLFVTGTDVHGRIYTNFDEAGNPVAVKDHRTLFLLKHRAGRKEPFAVRKNTSAAASGDPETTRRSLAKLSRITATFPVAFPPVRVAGPDSPDRVDANLRLWGWFDRETYFLDGGVLDNKPFTYTIREIFYRLASRRVDRRLFYVEPDPKRFEQPETVPEPNMVEVVVKSLVSIPGYESIADDLKLLAEHNDRVARHQKLVEGLEQAATPEELKLREEASRDSTLYRQTRITFLAEKVVRAILKQDGHHRFLGPDVRALAAELFNSVHSREEMWQEVLEEFDVYFRLRRLFHVLYSCPDPEPDCSPEENRLRREILHCIGRQIKLLEIVAAAMERLIGEADFNLAERRSRQVEAVLHKVKTALGDLLSLTQEGPSVLPESYDAAWREKAPDDWLDQPTLSKVNKALEERVATIKNQLQEEAPVLPPAGFAPAPKLFEATDACEARMMAYFSREIDRLGLAAPGNLTIKYNKFIWLDAQLFPLEAFAGFGERDLIETVRISPVDAQRGFSRVAAAGKVLGDVMAHFGGFFKKSWRSNDILWGRLDGLCLLVESLLKPEKSKVRLKKVLENTDQCQRLRRDLQDSLNPANLFPHASRQTRETLRDWLARLVSGRPEEREAALEDFDRYLELLIEAAHLEVLYEEVPRVIADALEEQARWGPSPGSAPAAGEGAKPPAPGPSAWSSFRQQGTAGLDELVLAVSAEELAKQALAEMAATPPAGQDVGWPRDDGLGRFFVEKYRVGEESLLHDVPRAYFWEMTLNLLPVVRHCLVKATDKYAAALQENFLFKYIDWALRGGVRLAGWFLRQPWWKKVAAGAAGALVLLALVIKLLF